MEYNRRDILTLSRDLPNALLSDNVYRGVLICTGELVNVRELVAKKSNRYGCPEKKLLLALSNWRSLSHPYILSLYAVVVGDGNLPTLVITEAGINSAQNVDLITTMAKYHKTLAWDVHGLRLCLQVAKALAYLHGGVASSGQCVIHGNLTTSNVFITEEFTVAKLGNIGMAVATGSFDLDFAAPELFSTAGQGAFGIDLVLSIKSDIFRCAQF